VLTARYGLGLSMKHSALCLLEVKQGSEKIRILTIYFLTFLVLRYTGFEVTMGTNWEI
jgi:hypothetical protein